MAPPTNSVRFNAAGYGTADFVVASAPTGYVVPESANATDGKTYRYYAQSADGTQWEAGSGPYTVSTHTLARTTIQGTSNGDTNLVAFALAPIVDVFASPSSFLDTPDVLYTPMSLTPPQQAQARTNVGVDTATAAKTANYTVVATDYGSLINCSGTFTLSFTAAATLGDKFKFYFRNTGPGIVTVDPNGAETVNGYATYPLFPGESCEIFCDGVAFWTAGLGTGEVLLNTATASNSAVIDFTNLPNTWFSEYRISLTDVFPVTANQTLGLRGSISGAFQQNSSDYDAQVIRFDSSAQAVAGDIATFGYIPITAGSAQTNAAGSFLGALTGDIRAKSMDGSGPPRWTWHTSYFSTANLSNAGGASYRAIAAMDGMRFFYTADGVSSGVFRLYGIRR